MIDTGKDVMPAATTHCVFAEQVLAQVAPSPALTKEELRAYYLGAQGPDFFFYALRRSAALHGRIGGLYHRDSGGRVLRALFRYVRGQRDSGLNGYLCGFVTHYLLDSAVHPYVNAMAKNVLMPLTGESEAVTHRRIESALDGAVCAWAGKARYDVADRLDVDDLTIGKVALCYAAIGAPLYDIELPAAAYARQIRSMLRVLRLLPTSAGRWAKVLAALENLAGKSHALSALVPSAGKGTFMRYGALMPRWPHPDGAEHGEEVPELIEGAKELAVYWIERITASLAAGTQPDFAPLTQNFEGKTVAG